jgi:DNA polymerase
MPDEELKLRKIAECESLRTVAQNCIACPLSETRTKVVFGIGNPNSPLMLIGEGPGASEDAIGEPFVGRAGKLLDECLYEAGMKRQHVYITNIVKCRASLIEGGRVKNRPPKADEIGTCVPLWLEKQIDIISPLVILCIGSPSATTIIRKDFRILSERGKFQETKYCKYTIAALHPAFILRQEGESYLRHRQSLVDDLRSAKERAVQAKSEPKLKLF